MRLGDPNKSIWNIFLYKIKKGGGGGSVVG